MALHVLEETEAREASGSRAPRTPLAPDTKARLAVLDLGSTSFHLLVADATSAGEVLRVARKRERLRLGAVIAERGHIPGAVRRRAVATARELRETALRLGAERVIPVATAAVRDAENGDDLAARIGEALGTPVRTLSGEEEARLIFGAFRHRVAFGNAEALGIDLGGGSLELATGDAFDVRWETTLPLGVARLDRELVRSDPMRRRERKAIRRRVAEALEPCLDVLRESRTSLHIASGGTVRALARLAADGGSDPRDGCVRVARRTLRRLAERLVASTHDERQRLPGVKRSRADLLPAGAVVLDALVDALEIPELVVCDWGLREGVVLEALGLVSAAGPGHRGPMRP